MLIDFTKLNTKIENYQPLMLGHQIWKDNRLQLLQMDGLEISNVPTNLEIHNILKLAGKVEIVDESKDIYKVHFETANTKAIYAKMKALISKHGLYRSYNLSKATKSSVFLEDLKLPASFVEEIKK